MSAIKGVNRRQFIAGSSILTAAALLPWSANVSAAVSSATDASGTPRKGGVLRISVDQAVGMLNPQQARVNPEYLVAELLYSGLTRLTQQMQAEADLAQSWKANDTLNQWTFILRPSLRFHDGSPCTASDVVASLQAVLDSKNASLANTISALLPRSRRWIPIRCRSPLMALMLTYPLCWPTRMLRLFPPPSPPGSKIV